MRTGLNAKLGNWIVVGALMVLMSMAPATDVQAQTQAQGLSQEEIDWLTYIREEEKLARDVYTALDGLWDLRIFKTIALSEQKHMDAIKTLLDRYEIPDPALADYGAFTNPDLKKLYDELIAWGSLSIVDALMVGVEIEETDIADLQAAILVSRHKDIKTVYTNLREGSRNHLDAFNSNLAKK